MKKIVLNTCAAMVLLLPLVVAAEDSILRDTLKPWVERFKGTMGIALKKLSTNDCVYINADERFPSESVIKVPVMVETFFQAHEQRVNLGESIRYRAAQKVGGSGILQHLHDGLKLTLGDAVFLMITLSDNTATNLVLDQTGVRAVNRRMEMLGLPNLKIFRKVFGKEALVYPEWEKEFGLGMVTPREMCELLEKIARKEIISPEACDQMISIMRNQLYNTSIPRYISGDGVWVANKTGSGTLNRLDAAIIHTPKCDYVLCVFTKNNQDTSWGYDNEAHTAMADISKLIFDYFMASD
jgi:beta-lactamase class A